LRSLDPFAIGAEAGHVPFLRFADDAQELFAEWVTGLMDQLRAGDEPPWMESHLAKYQSLAGRLALVIHLCDNGRGPVTAEALATALDWCEYLAGHARRIYSPAADSGITGANLILKRRPMLGETFTARDVYRRGWAGLDRTEDVNEALGVLVEFGHVRTIESPMPGIGGRPSLTYAWCVP
jgi:hypothetical protein